MTNALSTQFKKLDRDISLLESKVLIDLGKPQDKGRVVIKGYSSTGSEEVRKARSKKAVDWRRALTTVRLQLSMRTYPTTRGSGSLRDAMRVSVGIASDSYIVQVFSSCSWSASQSLYGHALSGDTPQLVWICVVKDGPKGTMSA